MLTQPNEQRKAVASATPKYISVRNAEAIVGQGYRWVRDTARALGVRVIPVGKKRLIPADEFFAAVERQQQVATTDPVDPTDAVLAQLGLQVRK